MHNKILKVINPLLFLAFLGTLIAMILYKVPGKLQFSEFALEMHTYCGVAMFVLAGIHIYLNWGWIRMNILGKKPSRKK